MIGSNMCNVYTYVVLYTPTITFQNDCFQKLSVLMGADCRRTGQAKVQAVFEFNCGLSSYLH